MKNIKTTFLSMLVAVGFSAAPAISFASNPSNTTNSEVVVANEAYSLIKKYVTWFKDGNMEFGITTEEQVKTHVGSYHTQYENEITIAKTFSGYTFDADWGMTEDGVLDYFEINTFYDADKYDQATKDGDEILGLMKKLFGEPEELTEGFYDWEYNDTYVSFNIFEDGYSIYVDPVSSAEEEEDITCVGDFYNLKKDLTDMFINNMKNGLIKIGTTTKSQMQSLTGDGELFDKDYDGLWVAGSYSYDDNGVLTSIALDYFYDCSGALILLDIDKGDITTLINDALGSNGFKDTDDVDATVRWNVNGQSLRQEGYEDGYAILFDK